MEGPVGKPWPPASFPVRKTARAPVCVWLTTRAAAFPTVTAVEEGRKMGRRKEGGGLCLFPGICQGGEGRKAPACLLPAGQDVLCSCVPACVCLVLFMPQAGGNFAL